MPVQRSAARQTKPIPPLYNGDRLTQPEFHRRYEAMPPNTRAELIGGIVYLSSPTRKPHGSEHLTLSLPLGLYESETAGVEAGSGATAVLAEDSEPEPDLALRILPEYGGHCTVNDELYWLGPPELVIESTHSTLSLDLNGKKRDYERNGVIEYAVFAVAEQEMRWFDLEAGKPIEPDRRGAFRSLVFPGLWIDASAVAAKNKRRLLSVARQGLQTPEHAAFVKRLKAAKRRLAKS
jgi:hypothetical protein